MDGFIFFKEYPGHDIDSGIGTLGGKTGGDQKLMGLRRFQRADGIGIRHFQPADSLFGRLFFGHKDTSFQKGLYHRKKGKAILPSLDSQGEKRYILSILFPLKGEKRMRKIRIFDTTLRDGEQSPDA